MITPAWRKPEPESALPCGRARAGVRLRASVCGAVMALLGGLCLSSSPVRAQEGAGDSPAAAAVATEILVVLASEEDGEIDPRLAKVEALRQPPFSTYRSMRVLSQPQVKLQDAKPEKLELPNGRTLKLELQDRMDDGRFKVKVSINKPDKNDYLPLLQVLASPGEPFFVAGQRHEGGTLVIGIRVGISSEKSAPKE